MSKRKSYGETTECEEDMARKQSITLENILDAAFEMTREEGFEAVTARKLAAKAGCSTQPIFRVYKNMEELGSDLFERAVEYFETFYSEYEKTYSVPFINLGMAYIDFAGKEKNLFRLLFLQTEPRGKSFYEILNGKEGFVVKEIAKAKEDGCKQPSEMFMHMWMLIHGAACMATTGDYDLGKEETVTMLWDAYRSFRMRK